MLYCVIALRVVVDGHGLRTFEQAKGASGLTSREPAHSGPADSGRGDRVAGRRGSVASAEQERAGRSPRTRHARNLWNRDHELNLTGRQHRIDLGVVGLRGRSRNTAVRELRRCWENSLRSASMAAGMCFGSELIAKRTARAEAPMPTIIAT
jgi:hypothetical protein